MSSPELTKEVLEILHLAENSIKTHGVSSENGVCSQEFHKEFKSNLRRKFKLSILGSGHFSSAIDHPTDSKKVIKIGFKKQDSGAAYAAFCNKHRNMVGAPHIYDIQRFEHFYVVIMKRYVTYRNAISLQDERDERHGIQDDNTSEVVRLYEDCSNIIIYDNDPEHEKDNHPMLIFAKEIRDFFEGIASFDLHSENVMFDTDLNQLIITDPVSFSKDRDVASIIKLEKELDIVPTKLYSSNQTKQEGKPVTKPVTKPAKNPTDMGIKNPFKNPFAGAWVNVNIQNKVINRDIIIPKGRL